MAGMDARALTHGLASEPEATGNALRDAMTSGWRVGAHPKRS